MRYSMNMDRMISCIYWFKNVQLWWSSMKNSLDLREADVLSGKPFWNFWRSLRDEVSTKRLSASFQNRKRSVQRTSKEPSHCAAFSCLCKPVRLRMGTYASIPEPSTVGHCSKRSMKTYPFLLRLFYHLNDLKKSDLETEIMIFEHVPPSTYPIVKQGTDYIFSNKSFL